MHRTSILSKHVNKFITLKVQLIFSALLSFYSMATLAVQNTVLETNINRSSIQSTPWKLWQEDNFFNVSYRVDNSTNLIEIRAQAKFESTLAGFLYFIEDLPMTHNWLNNAESAKLISTISPSEHIFKTRFNAIWPFADREVIVHSRYWQNKDLSIDILVEDAGDTVAITEDVLRMQVISAFWQIKPIQPKQIDVTYQFMVDPKGNIPKWLLKPMTLKGIWNTLQNMKEQLPHSKHQQRTKENIQEMLNVSNAKI
jgi:hypothetical protein